MSEGKWLVKSSGRILGPWTLEEIADQIRARQFSIFDEIREPHSRWLIVREHPMLAQVVRQIRDEHSGGVDTTQSTFLSGTKTLTSTLTATEEGSLTPSPAGRELDVMGRERTVNGGGLSGREFGALSDSRVVHRLESTQRRWAFLIYTLVLVFAGGAFWMWKSRKGPELTQEEIEERSRTATELASRGEYGRALEKLREVEKARTLKGQEAFLKTKLLLAGDSGSAIELSRTIEDLATSAVGVKVDFDLLRGLAQARLNRWKEASAFYDRVLQRSPQHPEASLNKAAAHLMMRDYSSAWNLLKAAPYSRLRGYYHVLKAVAAFRINDPAVKNQIFEEFKGFEKMDDQNRVRDFSREFFFERAMLMSAVALQAQNQKGFAEYANRVVQMSPFESKSYLRVPLLDWQVVDWKVLLPICESVKGGLRGDPSAHGIWSLCLAASGDLVGALNLSDQGLRQFQKEPSMAGVSALLLHQASRTAEADKIVGARAGESSKLLPWVQALSCEQRSDHSCAEKVWESVRAMDPFEPRAYFGIARAAKELGNDSQFINSSNTGLKYGPNYRPLLQMTGGKDDF